MEKADNLMSATAKMLNGEEPIIAVPENTNDNEIAVDSGKEIVIRIKPKKANQMPTEDELMLEDKNTKDEFIKTLGDRLKELLTFIDDNNIKTENRINRNNRLRK